MSIIEDYKRGGIKEILEITYKYRINKYMNFLMKPFLHKIPIKKVIVIESHNDFDSNGGALYEYMLEKGINNTYRIVWALKNKKKRKLPHNVDYFYLDKPSIKRIIYTNIACVFSADNTVIEKQRDGQVSIYLTHSSFPMKDVRGVYPDFEDVDYILAPAKEQWDLIIKQYGLKGNSNKLISLGFPVHDIMLVKDKSELKKVTRQEYKKVLLWMPTFRKGGGGNRNDSTKEYPYGVPLIYRNESVHIIDDVLKKHDILLIIKLHPMQNIDQLIKIETDNICMLTGEDVKRMNVDNYRLLRCVDALISDYSSIAMDFLLCDRPIGYVLEDTYEYQHMLPVENYESYLAGMVINDVEDMINFIIEVSKGDDAYKERRKWLKKQIFEFDDDCSRERILKAMNI